MLLSEIINIDKYAPGIILLFFFVINYMNSKNKMQKAVIEIKDKLIKNQDNTIEIQQQIIYNNRKLIDLVDEVSNFCENVNYSNNIIIVEQHGECCNAL